MNAQPKIYSAADLVRYHSGRMTMAEMHALEKDALDDPFLADALEGYETTASAERDAAALQQRISERTKDKKVFFLYGKSAPWMRAAAVLLLFAGIGYTFFRVNNTKTISDLAKNEPAKKIRTEVVNADTVTPQTPLADIAQNNIPQKSTAASAITNAPITWSGIAKQQAVSPVTNDAGLHSDSLYLVKKPNAADSKISPAPDEYKSFVLRGNVKNENGEPVDGAVVKVSGNTAVTDVTGEFEVQADRSVANATVSSVGYARKNVQLNGVSNNIEINTNAAEIAAAPINRSANSDVWESDDAKFKRALASKENAPASGRGRMEPVDSVVFIDYFERSKKDIPAENKKTVKGKIVLSFTVNKKGQPENIQVETPLCTSCDEQAVQLLKAGPKWIYSGTKRKQVAIEF